MCRLIDEIVRSGLVTAWRFASCPTRRSPVLVKATTDGVVLLPSEFGMTVGVWPSITATTEFVVPRSMPTTLAMRCNLSNPATLDHLHPGRALTLAGTLSGFYRLAAYG